MPWSSPGRGVNLTAINDRTITPPVAGQPQSAPSERGIPWVPALGGFAAMTLILFGAVLPSSPFSTKLAGAWFFGIPSHGTSQGGLWFSLLLVYGGTVVLLGCWLDLVRRAGTHTLRQLFAVAGMWVVPLLAAPPLLSRDAYAYGAEGQLVRAGFNPYSQTLLAHRASVFFRLSDPLWRAAHAPYGPLFFDLARLNARVMGNNVTATLEGYRFLALVGLGLVAAAVPVLARACGQPVEPAVALRVLNPLLLLYLIGGMHNDALMLGLLTAGVALATRHHPVSGIALCALAADVKVPGALGVVFIGWMWAGPGVPVRQRVRMVSVAVALGAAAMASVSVASRLGWGWLTDLSTPGTVVSWLDPATAAGLALTHVCRALGLSTGGASLVDTARLGALALAAVVVLYLLVHVDTVGLPRALGWSLLSVVLLGPIVWPWYEAWGITILAVAADRWSRIWTLALSVIACFATVPSGVSLSGGAMLAVIVILAVLAAMTVVVLRRTDPVAPSAVRVPPERTP